MGMELEPCQEEIHWAIPARISQAQVGIWGWLESLRSIFNVSFYLLFIIMIFGASTFAKPFFFRTQEILTDLSDAVTECLRDG